MKLVLSPQGAPDPHEFSAPAATLACGAGFETVFWVVVDPSGLLLKPVDET